MYAVYQQVIEYLKKTPFSPRRRESIAVAVMREVTGPPTGPFVDDDKGFRKTEATRTKQLAHHWKNNMCGNQHSDFAIHVHDIAAWYICAAYDFGWTGMSASV